MDALPVMGRNDFGNLSTEAFRRRMQPKADAIYRRLFPDCWVDRLNKKGSEPHILDQKFGIDAIIMLPLGPSITCQEKFREHYVLESRELRVDPECPDFTQEYMNAAGTKHQALGEWFKLAAELYFYGFANKQETDFECWFLMDTLKYKLIVMASGGLEEIGEQQVNRKHGRASFFAIPFTRLRPAWLATHTYPYIQMPAFSPRELVRTQDAADNQAGTAIPPGGYAERDHGESGTQQMDVFDARTDTPPQQ